MRLTKSFNRVFNCSVLILFLLNKGIGQDTASFISLGTAYIAFDKNENLEANHFYVNGKRIERLAPQSSLTILEQTGLAYVQRSQQGGGSPVLNGFEANRILLVTDNVRGNSAIFRSGHLQNFLTYDPMFMQSLEVTNGASSLEYGSDALGGILKVKTKRVYPSFGAGEESKVEIKSQYESVNRYMGGTLTSEVTTDRWGSFTGLSYRTQGDLRSGVSSNPFDSFKWLDTMYVNTNGSTDNAVTSDSPFIQKQSGFSQINFLHNSVFATDPNCLHTFSIKYSELRDVNRFDRLTLIQDSLPKYAVWKYGPQLNTSATYTYEKNQIEKSNRRQQFIADFTYFRESRIDRRYNSLIQRTRLEEVYAPSLRYQDSKDLDSNGAREYGFSLFMNHVESIANEQDITTTTETNIKSRYPGGGNDYWTLFAYLSKRKDLDQHWRINYGGHAGYSLVNLRFTDPTFTSVIGNTSNQANPVYAAEATIHRFGKLHQSLKISSAYKVPNIDDLAKVFDSNPGFTIVPNPSLKPEQVITGSYELKKKVNRVLIRTNFYGSLWFQTIQLENSTWNDTTHILYDGQWNKVQQLANVGTSRILGANFLFRGDLSDKVSASGSLTIQNGETTNGESLSHIPPFYGQFSLSYHDRDWRFELYSLFNGSKNIENYGPGGTDRPDFALSTGMPAWFTINLRAALDLHRLLLVLKAENLLDTHYRTFASGLSAPGTNLSILAVVKI